MPHCLVRADGFCWEMEDARPILLAEDEENDFLLMCCAFEEAGVKNRLVRCADGRQAISYLSGHGPYEDRARHPLPCLVITDMKMPNGSGLDLLQWMRGHTPDIPAVVLTGSLLETDVNTAIARGASAYYEKPSGLAQLLEWVRIVARRWLCQFDEAHA